MRTRRVRLWNVLASGLGAPGPQSFLASSTSPSFEHWRRARPCTSARGANRCSRGCQHHCHRLRGTRSLGGLEDLGHRGSLLQEPPERGVAALDNGRKVENGERNHTRHTARPVAPSQAEIGSARCVVRVLMLLPWAERYFALHLCIFTVSTAPSRSFIMQ